MFNGLNKILFVGVNAKYVHTNLAVRYLNEFCKRDGFDCDFVEFSINEPRGNVLEKLYMSDCDVYGFSCYIWNIEYVLQICKNLKILKPDCKIILGGPEVSFDAENQLLENPFIDFVVCGEGEAAVLNLLKDIENSPRVVFGKKIDLAELPFPYTDDDLDKIVGGEKLIYYETSRGCPFNCSYCLSSVEKGVSFLPIERVKTEITKMVEHGAITIKFVDRTFNADKKRAMEIWEHCLSLEGNTCFHFEIGADLLDEDTLELLKDVPNGKFQFEIGVQTTNPKTISAVSRTMNLDKLKHNVIYLKKNSGIYLHLDLIAGLPFEDYASFAGSFNDVYELGPHVLQLGFLKLLKGSALRRELEKFDMKFSLNPPYEIFSNSWLTYDEIINLKAVEDVLERYFNSNRFEKTLSVIIRYFKSPFELYEKLSKLWQKKGLIGQGVKRISLYDVLYEFLTEELNEPALNEAMLEMKKDFSKWHSNGVGTPKWYKLY